MACEECTRARASQGHWSMYDNRRCVYCAARLIQAIGKLQIPREDISRRRTVILQESVAAGHREARIRELVKGPLALEPVEKDKEKANK